MFKNAMECLDNESIKDAILANLSTCEAPQFAFAKCGYAVLSDRLGEECADKIFIELWHKALNGRG